MTEEEAEVDEVQTTENEINEEDKILISDYT